MDEPAPVHYPNRDVPVVHVLADNRARALEWARVNKPRALAKTYSTASEIGPRGLHIPDEPVFVLDAIPEHVRAAWLVTRCKLVYV